MALDLDISDIDPVVTLVSRLKNYMNTLSGQEGPYAEALKNGVKAALAVIEEAVADAYREISTGDVSDSGLSSQVIDQELDSIVGVGSSGTSGGSGSSGGSSSGGSSGGGTSGGGTSGGT